MGNDNPNPKHAEILNAIPAELHPVVIPVLKKWDQGVQERFTEIHKEYEEYKAFKPFIDNNIDFDYAANAVQLANELQNDPRKIVEQVVEAWELDFVPKDQVVTPGLGDGDPEEPFSDDILKHPVVKQMQDALDKLQNDFKSEKEQEEEEAAIQEFEQMIDELEDKAKSDEVPFNRMFVTALITQGIEPEAAVKQYTELLAGNVSVPSTNDAAASTSTDAPVVMGGDGTVGGGTPDGSIDFGSLKKNALNDTVEELLKKQAESGQG